MLACAGQLRGNGAVTGFPWGLFERLGHVAISYQTAIRYR